MTEKKYTLAELAKELHAELKGDSACVITHLAPLDKAKKGAITFLTDIKYQAHLESTEASAVVLTPEFASQCKTNSLIMQNPYLGFARLAAIFDTAPKPVPGIHPSAVVAKTATLGVGVSIAAGCVVGEHAKIGARTVLKANVVVEDFVEMGEAGLVHPNATIYHHCKIGDRVVIQAAAVIGSDGFGMAKNEQGAWVKIPQLGRVVIGNDVEIGASTTIDRGAIEDTIIHDNVKLDNQIQIAHNVEIGKGTAIAACTGIAGSTKIGKNCLFGGAVGISGHLEITDGVMLTAQSGVSKSITESGVYSSSLPILPMKLWAKVCARIRNLDELAKRFIKLEAEKLK